MRANVEMISPHVAKELLERMEKNRPLSEATVSKYASDMSADRWEQNGQGIVLSVDNVLLDGQHRLRAIIASQKTVAMLVVRGVDSRAFITMDSGKGRGLADVLAIEGFTNTNSLAAMARGSYSYVAGVKYSSNPTRSTLESFINRHPYTATVAKMIGSKKQLCPPGPLGAVLFLANEKHNFDAEVNTFFEGLVYGEGMWKGDARLTLREWLLNRKTEKSGAAMRSETIFAAVARAWNAYATGKELTKLRQLMAPTRHSLPIVGFDRLLFPDVPDLIEIKREKQRSNLANYHETKRHAVTSGSAL